MLKIRMEDGLRAVSYTHLDVYKRQEHKQLFKYADEAYELLRDEFTPDKYDKMDIFL